VAAGMRGPWHAGMAACVRAGTVVRRDVRRRATGMEWEWNRWFRLRAASDSHLFQAPPPARARSGLIFPAPTLISFSGLPGLRKELATHAWLVAAHPSSMDNGGDGRGKNNATSTRPAGAIGSHMTKPPVARHVLI